MAHESTVVGCPFWRRFQRHVAAGNTTTETPRLSTALRMAIASTCGICSGLETSSQ
ncbi:hypothetical protein ACVXG9_13965 [Escherichia coli]